MPKSRRRQRSGNQSYSYRRVRDDSESSSSSETDSSTYVDSPVNRRLGRVGWPVRTELPMRGFDSDDSDDDDVKNKKWLKKFVKRILKWFWANIVMYIYKRLFEK